MINPEIQCTVITPERTVYDEIADFVALTLYDGEMGIAPGRAPLIGRLGCGELRILQGANVARYYIEGGFVEVLGNAVSVLTHRAVPAAELQPAMLEEQLAGARARTAHTPELMAARDHAVHLVRAQLRVARRAT
jgi:F-type H+-transporting ATPase subunit epsilon